MRIRRSLDQVTDADRGAVAAIGNFDGVHQGHRRLVEVARDIARGSGAPLAAITFEPHPRRYFAPDAPPFRLSDAESRAAALADLGVELIVELIFDEAFAHIPAEEFVTGVVHGGLGLSHLVIGYDFSFGHRRRGGFEMLKEMAGGRGFGVTRVDAVTEADGAVFSSTRVRQCLAEGDPKGAAEQLGRPWEVVATVEQGDQRGRTIGFPTANLRLGDLIEPARGVYAVRVQVEGESGWRNGVANFGRRPTVNDRGALLEVHVFDYDGDLYGKRLRVAFVDFIRAEMKFPGLDALVAQIAADAERARGLLAAGG